MQQSQTFVLRFWVEKHDDTEEWRGVIIHVPSNEQTAASSAEEAFMIIQKYLTLGTQSTKEEHSCPE